MKGEVVKIGSLFFLGRESMQKLQKDMFFVFFVEGSKKLVLICD